MLHRDNGHPMKESPYERRCGSTVVLTVVSGAAKDNISSSLIYPSKRPGIFLTLRFDTWEGANLDSIESSEPKRPDGSYPPEWIWWWRSNDTLDESPRVAEALPCLHKECQVALKRNGEMMWLRLLKFI